MFTHYLITRFNIKIAEHGPERMVSPVADEAWLTNRIPLFLRYCVPSVLAQKNTHFTWLIYFDNDTPVDALEKLNYLQSLTPKIEFVFVKDFTHMLDDLNIRFKASTDPYIISSRLDNDDMISDQYIACIQNAFIPETNTVININSGYVLDMDKKVLTLWRNKLTNQFGSLIESAQSEKIISIYGFPHWKPPFQSKTISIHSEPCWVEMIHSANNRRRGSKGIPVFHSLPKESFPEISRRFRISFRNTIWYTMEWFPSVVTRRISELFK